MHGQSVSEKNREVMDKPNPPDVFLVGDDGDIRYRVNPEVFRCVFCGAWGTIDTTDCNRRCVRCGNKEGCEG